MGKYPVISDQIDVIWKKEQFIKCSRESIPSPTLASGDACDLHCCLCRSSSHLHLITNEHLDETLRLYFGVNVPPNRLICESCIKCMKITEGFSALVHASFGKISPDSSRHSKILSDSQATTTLRVSVPNPQKKILSLLKTKLTMERKPPKRSLNPTAAKNCTVLKKMMVACTKCGQKYLMCMPADGQNKFVCSRCQKQGNKKFSALSRVNGLCGKTDLTSCRIRTTQTLQVKPQPSTNLPSAKHQCNQCPKMYAIAENLEHHEKNIHSWKPCALCGRKFKSAEALKSHLKEHSRIERKAITGCKSCLREPSSVERKPFTCESN